MVIGNFQRPRRWGEARDMTVVGQGFGCRPLEGRRRVFGGRRPKASKEGNRA